MPAYLIAQVRIHDPAPYKQYAARSPAIIAAYGGRVLARGPAARILEGSSEGIRVVIVEFPSVEAAQRFHSSAEYQEIYPIRAAASQADVLIVESAESA